jgi:hypothetical protein
MGSLRLSVQTVIIYLNSDNQSIFLIVKCGVLFEVRTEHLNIIYMRFDFKWLILNLLSVRYHSLYLFMQGVTVKFKVLTTRIKMIFFWNFEQCPEERGTK